MNSIMQMLWAKEESVDGTDSTPASSNAIEVEGLTVTPTGENLDRPIQSNTLSPAPRVTGKRWYDVKFTAYLKGSGSAGTAPIIGDLLEACGRTEVVSAGNSVTYNPCSSTMKSCTLYAFEMLDNTTCVKHIITGCRGNVNIVAEAGKPARAEFTMQGKYTEPTDTTVTFTTYPETTLPPIVDQLAFTLNAVTTLVLQSLNIDFGNKVVMRDDINSVAGVKGFAITGRAPSGKANPEAVTKATYNWWNDWTTAAQRALSLTIGSVAGNKITITAPKVQVGAPVPGNRDGNATKEIDFVCVKNTANDELVIVFS